MHPFTITPSTSESKRWLTAAELAFGGAVLVLAGWLLPSLITSPLNWVLAVLCYAVTSVLVMAHWPDGALGWANRVTLTRAVLVALVAGALANEAFIASPWLWLGLAVVALLLDGVDGWIARRTRSHSQFGARFDMELDALLILLLCVGLMLSEALGGWVLLIGGMRYLFIAASWPFTWLSQPLFVSLRRKAVCVWQVVALLLALTPLTDHLTASLLALSALVTLAYSFGVDGWWLYRQAKHG